jgi:hypothetical protein
MSIRSLAFLALVTSTAMSYAGPAGKTCAKACQRFSDCKLLTFKFCMELCGNQGAEDTAESRASNLTQARSSCPALAAQMAPSQWLCTAEGASVYGYDVASGRGDVQGTSSIYIHGQGKTRSVAVYNAVSNCNSLMTLTLTQNRAMHLDPSPLGQWGTRISSQCHITQCFGPK